MGHVTYKLKKSITVGDTEPVTVTELRFRDEVVAGDLRGIKLSALADPLAEDVLKLAGRLCAQPDPVMNRLSLDDLLEVVKLVQGFTGAGQTAGTGPSPQ